MKSALEEARRRVQSQYPADGTSESDDVSELTFSSVGGIMPEAIRFLVPGYVPAGMMGMLAGEGGHGKSMTTLELAAAISVGRCAFGLSYENPTKGKTLLISCEDDWTRTIVPRLAALGADRSQILRVEGIRMKKSGKILDFHLGHYRQLQCALEADPEIKLIVVDPAGAFIGRAGVNENHDSELRALLGPLSEAANSTGATVLLIKHLNKSAGVSAVQRVGGSVGYINAVRFAHMIAPDPDDADKKLMIPIKANVLPSGTRGLAFRMVALPEEEAVALLQREWPEMKSADVTTLAKQLFRQAWEGNVDVDANQVAGAKAKAKSKANKQEDVEACAEMIRQFLGGYSCPEKEIEEAIKKAGFTFSTYMDAKAQLRSDDRNDPNRLSAKPFVKGGPWWMWIGPQGDPLPARLVTHTYKTRESYETCETSETCRNGSDDGSDCGDSKFTKTDKSHKSFKTYPPDNKSPRLGSVGEGGEL